MKAYQALPELLRADAHDVVFGMLGRTNAPWVAEGVRAAAFRLVNTRHEEASGHAAAGYWRTTGKTGVLTVTSGPGFVNAIQALVVAKHAHIPVLLIVHECPAPSDWVDTDVDQRAICASIGVDFHQADSTQTLAATYRGAVQAAHRNGSPQVLSLRDGLLDEEMPEEFPASGVQPTNLESARGPAAPEESIRRVVDTLSESRSPLILAGQGVVVSGARDALVALAEATGARLATTLRAIGLFEGHPRNIGISGGWASPAAQHLLGQSDIVMAFGAAMAERTTLRGRLYENATVVHCEVDAGRPLHASRSDLALVGDARATAEALLAAWQRRSLQPRTPAGSIPSFEHMQQEIRAVDVGHDPGRGLDIRDVYLAFGRVLAPDRVVVTDSGRVLNGCSLVRVRDASSFVPGRGYGTVGLGLGTAIGACVGCPGRQVALFCGDGGFSMGISALDTARLYGLDLTVVILNDQRLGSEVKHLRRYGLPLEVISQSLVGIPGLAATYGGIGQIVRTQEELSVITPGRGLRIYDCRIDPEVDPAHMFQSSVEHAPAGAAF